MTTIVCPDATLAVTFDTSRALTLARSVVPDVELADTVTVVVGGPAGDDIRRAVREMSLADFAGAVRFDHNDQVDGLFLDVR